MIMPKRIRTHLMPSRWAGDGLSYAYHYLFPDQKGKTYKISDAVCRCLGEGKPFILCRDKQL
jgi:hypothetical protein